MSNRRGFQPGHSGRPKGTRNRLTAQVFEDLFRHWNDPVADGSEITKGQEALQKLWRERPNEYARLVVSVLPKEFVFENAVTELDDDQVDALIMQLRQRVIDARAAAPTLLVSPEPVEVNDDSD